MSGHEQQGRLVAAAAANLAGWHDLHLRSIGHRTDWRDGSWLTPDRVPVIFFSAIGIRPGASAQVIADTTATDVWTAVCDPWSDVELAGNGYRHLSDQVWMARPPGPVGDIDGTPSGLAIERVRDVTELVTFEATAAMGFGSGEVEPHAWHGPDVLADPRLAMWVGRVDDRPVAVAMGFADAGVLGIYGVATIPRMRRRGYATALTAHAIASAADLTAVLQPSRMAESLYRRLGFERFGVFRTWIRDG